jgi:hypothetical protein
VQTLHVERAGADADVGAGEGGWYAQRVRGAPRRAIERLGMRFDGVLRAARTAFDGGIRDSAYYSMLDSEWPEARAALEKRLRPT